MITYRVELIRILESPQVQAALAAQPAHPRSVTELAAAIIEAAGPPSDQPVGERWDAVEWTLENQLGIRASGHVGRAPIMDLAAWENIVMRLTAAEALLAHTRT